MKRWIPAAVVGGGLFLFNLGARVVVEVSGQAEDPDAQFTIGLYATLAMTAVALFAGAWWGVRKPADRIVAELGLALLVSVLLSVFIGPLLVGSNPFNGGVGWIIIQVLFFFAVSAVGALVGYLGVTMFGVDYRSKNLKRVERHFGNRTARR